MPQMSPTRRERRGRSGTLKSRVLVAGIPYRAAFPTGKCAVAILVSEATNRALSEWTIRPEPVKTNGVREDPSRYRSKCQQRASHLSGRSSPAIITSDLRHVARYGSG